MDANPAPSFLANRKGAIPPRKARRSAGSHTPPPSWGLARSSVPVNPYGYTGREWEQTNTYYYRARFYLPYIGQFYSIDPLWQDFKYADNSPLYKSDPFGLNPGPIDPDTLHRPTSRYSPGPDEPPPVFPIMVPDCKNVGPDWHLVFWDSMRDINAYARAHSLFWHMQNWSARAIGRFKADFEGVCKRGASSTRERYPYCPPLAQGVVACSCCEKTCPNRQPPPAD